MRLLGTFAALLLVATAAYAQVSVTDNAGPKVIVPAQTTPQFLVLNMDSSLQGYSTSTTSNYTLTCGAPSGVSVAAGTSLTLAVDDRSLTTFQTGASSQGPAALGRSTPSNGSNCVNSPSVLIGGGAATALLSTEDHFHQRLYVVSQDSGTSADTITAFNTAGIVFNRTSETLTQSAQATLDTAGTYTSVVSDVDGTYGDTIVTELRTSTSAGGLWFFNTTTGKAIRILGPGGVALPAINAFILHNPNNGGGGLLVLANQDGLTSANLISPPSDTAPFSIIDLGQLDSLIAYNSTATTITLPAMTTINSSLGYYAMLGAAYNPVTRLLYAVVGGGTSTNSVSRQIVSYDPGNPSSPAETVVADVSSAPLTSASNTQVALNAAAGTMQILGKDTNTVYTAAITGTGNTGTQVTGTTFSDTNFVPTYIASNPLLGETYIASKTQVDILTKPAANKIQLTLDLTGAETLTAAGAYSASLLVTSPNPVDFGLSSTSVTVTATPQGGTPYTFGSVPAAYGTGSATTINGNFPSAGIYTLVASFPGDTVTAAATSSPVVVAVGQALFPTQTTVSGTFNSSTGAGNATVNLTGTTYTPGGTITLTSVNTGNTLVTYTLQPNYFYNPITFGFTAPPSTTQIKAAYSGDALNQASVSAAATLTTSQATVTPKLVLTLPSTGTTNTKVHLNVTFTSSSSVTPTGTIVVAAAMSGTAFNTIANISAAQAFAPGGAGYDWTPTVAGQYFFTLYYDGDSNYGLASVSNAGSITISGATSAVTFRLNAPSTATQGTAFNLGVVLLPTGANATGNITITAVKSDATTVTLGSVSAATAATAAGATLAATFASNGVYTLNGSYAGDSNYAAATSSNLPTITVSGGTLPTALLTPTSAMFTAAVGFPSASQAFTLYSIGGAALTLGAVSVSNSAFVQFNGCQTSLAPGTNCVIRVQFAPTATGSATGSLIVNTNDANSPARAALSGTATAGTITLTPATFSFNDQTVGTSSFVRPTLVLRNTGTTAFTVTGATLSNTSDFDLLGTGCAAGTVVQASMSCTQMVYFHPSTATAKTGVVTFTTSNSASVQTALSGNGLASGACTDTDGDGLCDDWEQNGVWVRVAGKPDQFIDLPSMGASYTHKDIFIQADYMGTAAMKDNEHSHQMTLGAQAIDIASFNNAPVANVDGTFGIHIHIDCGFYCIMDPVKNTTWGNTSQATEIVEQAVLNATPYYKGLQFDWTSFDAASTGFQASGRSLIFHHALFAHNQNPMSSSSGVSRNAPTNPAFFTGASDLVVSLGSWTGMTGSDMEQAGTLMHELGHNLGLAHGGNDDTNYKVNYLSVMNYNYQTVGLIVNGVTGTFDYSRFNLPTFDETLLNEQKGLQYDGSKYPGSGSASFPDITKYGVFWYCPGADSSKDNPVGVQYVNGVINWDCDKKQVISTTPVAVDANGDGLKDYYPSFNDWPALVYTGGAIAGNGIGVTPLMQTSAGEITMEQAGLNVQSYAVSVTGMGGVHTLPGSSPTIRFVVTNKGLNADVYALTPSVLGGWTLAAGTPQTLTLAAGAAAEVALTYTVPATANEGDSNLVVLSAVSQGTPTVHDSRQVNVYATATPGPVAFSLSTVIFGTQNVGVSGLPISVVVVNTGASALSMGTIATTAEFAQTNTCGTSLAVGASCSVGVTFTPAAAGARTGTLTINTGAGLESIALTGTSVVPSLPLPEVTLTSTPTATSTGQNVMLTANVASFPAGATPTGTVTFLNGTTQLGQATLDAPGNATFASTTLGAGTYNLIAQYSGDTAFRAASSPYSSLVIATATPTTTMLATSAAAVATGTSVTFTATVGGGSGTSQPTGSVRFYDGTVLLGTGTLNASGVATFTTSTLSAATHSITAVYSGDSTFGVSTSSVLLETVGTFVTTTALTTTASPVTVGASVTLTATVTATAGTPTGTVTFTDGAVTLGTGTLNATGVATYTTSTLAVGTHNIVASYAATGNFGASASAAKQVIVTALPDYSVAANPSSLTVTSGTTGTAMFTVTPVNGYANSVSFSCGTLPTYATCTFTPAKLTFTATAQTAQTTTLTLSTTQGQATLTPFWKAQRSQVAFAMLMPLALFGFSRKRRRTFRGGVLLVLALVSTGLIAVSGCAGGSSAAAPATTPAGVYTVPITITDGTTAHSIQYMVTVK